ncbi:hypothetical protein JHK82_024294 [Glycine max]|nr:hypothetical protein JHK85_024875 [Glycine max]KAG5133106.1 hypothetical protein JHK82_024294 [Glycine max]
MVDFIANVILSPWRVLNLFLHADATEYAKLPQIPPFLQPNVDYSNGINFASGGAGVLAETNQGLVIDLPTQLRYFEEVRKSLAEKLGKKKAKELISEAIYFISVGINDYMALYLKANKSDSFEAAFALDLAHNNALNNVLTSLKHFLEGFMHSNSNFYDWLLDRIDNPTNYGFKDKINACCGSGPFGGIFTCGGTMKVRKYNLCDNVEEYVWWDSIHGTEKINEQFSKALWNGPPSFVGPYNLKNFFNNEMIKLTIADVGYVRQDISVSF